MALDANGPFDMAKVSTSLLVHPFDETFDSVETGETSFSSGDEEENLIASLLVDEDEEGLETPLRGIKCWTEKRTPTLTTLTNLINEQGTPQDPDDLKCIEATPSGIQQDQPSETGVTLTCTKTGPSVSLIPQDPEDRSCVEATVDGVTLDQPVKENDAAACESEEEEGVEVKLNAYKKATRLILMDLKGAEVETTGKKVRFDIDGKSKKTNVTEHRRRKKLLKFLRKKTKREASVGCPPLVQMMTAKPTTSANATTQEPDSVKGASTKFDHQANEFKGVAVELYNSFLGAVVESYLICSTTVSYLEEQVLNCADTEFLREFLDDEYTVGSFDKKQETQNVDSNCNENQLAETFSFEVLRGDASGAPVVMEKSTDGRRFADV